MLIAITGCAVVHVSGTKPSTSWNIGLVNVQIPQNGETPALIATEGIGFVLAGRAATFGWVKEVVVLAPDSIRCRVFVIVTSDEELRALGEAFSNESKLFENICIFSGEGEIWEKKRM